MGASANRDSLHWGWGWWEENFGPEIVGRTIAEHIKVAQNRQKSYANLKMSDIHYKIGDKVFLKVAPVRGVVRFGGKRNLKPWYIWPFEILEMVGEVAYRLALPPSLTTMHNAFHISLLKMYKHDSNNVVNHDNLKLKKDLSYKEYPKAVLDS